MRLTRSFAVLTCALSASLITGCTGTYVGRLVTLQGPDVADYKRLPSRPVEHRPDSDPLHTRWNRDWVRQVPFAAGTTLIDEPWELDRLLSENGSTAFIVLHDGAVVDERYYHGHRRDSMFKSFSMSKSLLSALIGIAQDEGVLASDDRVAQHLDTGDAPALGALTLEQLLDNISGFEYERGFLPWKQQPRMYYTTDVRHYVRTAEFAHPPGKKFESEDISPLLLGVVLEAALRKRDPEATLSGYASQRLWQPMGAEFPALWVIDREDDGIEKTESGFTARAIDLARFGQLYLDDGAIADRQVVPSAWIEASIAAPARGSPNLFREGYYQNLWWGYFRDGRRKTDFYANGHFGQRIYVSPDKRLVIVRLGYDKGGIDWTETLARIADAWPAR